MREPYRDTCGNPSCQCAHKESIQALMERKAREAFGLGKTNEALSILETLVRIRQAGI